jgi:hypothetical protein
MQFIKTYGPYRGKDGRARVVHYFRGDGSERTSSESYPRYLWRQHFGEIPEGMEVDHKNDDPTDDRIENYQLLPHGPNVRKAFKNNRAMVEKLAAHLRTVQPLGVEASRRRSG